MKWIGLTGGIATGKSTVKKLIEGQGVSVIDADLISHQLTEVGATGYEKVLSHFGNEVLNADQTLNRSALGKIIFNNLEKRNQLESLLHPLIQTEVLRQKNLLADAGQRICFYDVPLLFEKKLEAQFDLIVLIWCDPHLQKHRLKLRNHLTQDEVEARLASQMRMSSKIYHSHYCLDNSSDLRALQKQVEQLFKTIV
jgi:dephospho-CoA kinase